MIRLRENNLKPPIDLKKLDGTTTIERPLKICIAFEEDGSARSAEVLIKHVASNFECETQLFPSVELDSLGVAPELRPGL